MRGSAGRGAWAQRGPPSALVPRRAALPALWRERAAAATRPALRPRAGAAVWVACRREPGRASGPRCGLPAPCARARRALVGGARRGCAADSVRRDVTSALLRVCR